MFFQTDYLHSRFSAKMTWAFLANIGSNREIHRNKVFSSQKNKCTFVIFDLIERFQLHCCKSGTAIFSIEGHLKLHLQPWPLKGLITKNAMTNKCRMDFAFKLLNYFLSYGAKIWHGVWKWFTCIFLHHAKFWLWQKMYTKGKHWRRP